MAGNASHALASSVTAKPTFNVEEEVVVIRNGWTPKKKIIPGKVGDVFLFSRTPSSKMFGHHADSAFMERTTSDLRYLG